MLSYNFGKNFYCISSRMENSGQLYGCFKIGPFYGHHSLTFANTLRRTLLADKSRCIFEAVQIQGVEHEFSSLVGVRESVIDIILNLERVVFQINKPITKPQIAIINFHGPGILRAQHIHLPTNINCIVPSQYIATLEIDGQLRIKLFFTPNWYKFQQFLQSNILNNEEKIFQKIKYPKFQNKKKAIKFNNKFSFLLSQLQKFSIHLKDFTFIRYLPFLKSQLSYNFSKNNKINFREIAATVSLKKKKNNLQSIKKIQTLKTNSFQQIQENFLFLQTSLCAIEKVHYTIQSNPISTSITETKLTKRNNKIVFNDFQKQSTINSDKRTIRSASQKGVTFWQPEGNAPEGPEGNPTGHKVTMSRRDAQKGQKGMPQKVPKGTLRGTISQRDTPRHPGANTKETTLRSRSARTFFAPSQPGRENPECLPVGVQGMPSVRASKTQFKHQLRLNKSDKTLFLSQKSSENTGSFVAPAFNKPNDLTRREAADSTGVSTQSKVIGFNRPLKKSLLSANNEEFVMFEVWTNGSIHPQKAIGKAINEILLGFFPYSFYLNKTEANLTEKINTISVKNQTSKLLNQSKINIQRKTITNISKKKFYEKFLNLEIGNFYFDLETYLYLKEKKIYRIVDFLNFFKKYNDSQYIELENSKKSFDFKKNLNNFEESSLLKSKYNVLNRTASQPEGNISKRRPGGPYEAPEGPEGNPTERNVSGVTQKRSPQIENTLLKFQTFITSFLYQ